MGEVYYAGIDLGTSRTSLSSSTGIRTTIRTAVGYPVDLIAKKTLGKDFLVGDEVFENRMSLNVVEPLVDGVINTKNPKSIEACRIVLETIIQRSFPDKTDEDKLYIAVGAPAEASSINKKDIIGMVKGIADRVIVVSEPFAVAYGLDDNLNALSRSIIIDVGAGSIDCARLISRLPTDKDNISLTTAGNFFDSVLTSEILSEYPDVQLTKEIIRKIKEKYGHTGYSKTVIVPLTDKGILKDYDITSALEKACKQFVDPICEAIQKLVGEFDPEFQHSIRNNIIIAGGGSRLNGIDKAIENSLEAYGGGAAMTVQDAEYSGSNGSLKIALEFPDEYWDTV